MKESKPVKYLTITAFFFSLFYFNIHWLINDEDIRTKFYITSTAFELLILCALSYQYSKLMRSMGVQSIACLLMIYSLGNYLDEMWGRGTETTLNEIVFGIGGLLLVIARFYREWLTFIMNKILPLILLAAIVYLITRNRIFTIITLLLTTTSYVVWILTRKK